MLKQTILNALECCRKAGRQMPDFLLQRECELVLGTRVGDNAFEQAISELKDAGEIEVNPDPVTLEPSYLLASTAPAQPRN